MPKYKFKPKSKVKVTGPEGSLQKGKKGVVQGTIAMDYSTRGPDKKKTTENRNIVVVQLEGETNPRNFQEADLVKG